MPFGGSDHKASSMLRSVLRSPYLGKLLYIYIHIYDMHVYVYDCVYISTSHVYLCACLEIKGWTRGPPLGFRKYVVVGSY